jgi:hypothetical protein
VHALVIINDGVDPFDPPFWHEQARGIFSRPSLQEVFLAA